MTSKSMHAASGSRGIRAAGMLSLIVACALAATAITATAERACRAPARAIAMDWSNNPPPTGTARSGGFTG